MLYSQSGWQTTFYSVKNWFDTTLLIVHGDPRNCKNKSNKPSAKLNPCEKFNFADQAMRKILSSQNFIPIKVTLNGLCKELNFYLYLWFTSYKLTQCTSVIYFTEFWLSKMFFVGFLAFLWHRHVKPGCGNQSQAVFATLCILKFCIIYAPSLATIQVNV